jgi:hypothetical protein
MRLVASPVTPAARRRPSCRRRAPRLHLADEARTALRRQAADGTGRAAGAIDQLAGHLRALAGGDPEQAGDLRRYAGDLGDRLGGVAGRINERGIGGLVEDVQRFARRRPGVFLAVAAGAGFAAGRLFRGAAAHSDDDAGSSGNGSTAYRPGAGATPEPGGAGGSTAALVTEGAEPGGPASGTTLGSVPQGGATGDDTPSGAR